MKDKKEWLYRAIRTFIQAAAGYVVGNLVLIDITDSNAVKTMVAAGIAAGIAAAMNADWNHIE